MYLDESQVCSAAKTRTRRRKIKGRKATKIKTSPGREGWFWCRDFQGESSARVTNRVSARRQESAPEAARPSRWQATWRGRRPGRTQVGRGGTAALTLARQGRGCRRRTEQRGYACEPNVQERKKGSSQRALQLDINNTCKRSGRNASESLGYTFRRPFNFPCLGVLHAPN